MWFRWEFSSVGWSPAVYHQERPRDRDGATATQDIPADCIGSDGEPMFGKLRERFPMPEMAQ